MNRNSFKARILASGVVVAGMLTVVTGATGGAASAAAKSSPYLIGVPMPMTGAEAQAGTQIYNAELMAAQQINKKGGVLGHQLKLIEQDDACDAGTAVNAANLLVSKGVQAEVGGYCSGATLPAEPIIARAGIPYVMPAANSPELTTGGYKNVFLIDPSGAGDGAEAAAFFKQQGIKKIFIIDDQSSFGVAIANAAAKDIKANGGTVTGGVQSIPATSNDFSAVISQIKSSGAKGIYWSGYFAQAAQFATQLNAAGIIGAHGSAKFVVADGSVDATYLSGAGAAGNGTYATIAALASGVGNVLGTHADQVFNAAYRKEFKAAPGPYSTFGYDAITALVLAAKDAKSIAPARVIAKLHTLSFNGLTGKVSFDKTGNRLGAVMDLLEVVNGKYTLAKPQPKL
ncbi:MAG: branched-chain amino acid ABC transporter substrate-binding protein [Acidobacteria bacterium]|nr:branched-chain amino acid ABC transporter substrate-binding protein [Acidobacteriota bacterium]